MVKPSETSALAWPRISHDPVTLTAATWRRRSSAGSALTLSRGPLLGVKGLGFSSCRGWVGEGDEWDEGVGGFGGSGFRSTTLTVESLATFSIVASHLTRHVSVCVCVCVCACALGLGFWGGGMRGMRVGVRGVKNEGDEMGDERKPSNLNPPVVLLYIFLLLIL